MNLFRTFPRRVAICDHYRYLELVLTLYVKGLRTFLPPTSADVHYYLGSYQTIALSSYLWLNMTQTHEKQQKHTV